MDADETTNMCVECENTVHVLDYKMYDRICTNCGLVTAIEMEEADIPVQFESAPRDIYRNHFNSIMKQYAPSQKGFQSCHMEIVFRRFKQLVGRFHETKALHGRKKMNYREIIRYIMIEQCLEDLIPPSMPRPKGKKTLQGIEKLWKILTVEYENST